MLKKLLRLACLALTILSMTSPAAAEEPVDRDPDKAGFQYSHDPMDYSEAAEDIIVNPDAIYGYSPNPESKRLGEFAREIDWTDPEEVAMRRKERQEYHDSLIELYNVAEEMYYAGSTLEDIAKEVSGKRNEIRLRTYRNDPAGLEMVKKSNLEAYGNESGPTAEFLYDRYGSWAVIIQKSFSSNPGMDACLGFFDEYYDLYLFLDMLKASELQPAVDTAVKPAPEYYTVLTGDSLWKLGVMYYDDGNTWESIYALNQNRIKNPSMIYPGMILRMP